MATNLPATQVIEDLRVEFFKRNLSHERIANLTGISTSAISRRMTGQTAVTLDELVKLAGAADSEVTITLSPISAPPSAAVGDSSSSKDAA